MSVYAWASICLVFVKVLDTEENSISLMFFFVFPFVILLSIWAAKIRRSRIRNCKITSSSSPFLVELKARFILEENGMLFSSKTAAPTAAATGPTENAPLVTDTDVQEKQAAVLKEITELYTQSSIDLSNSSMLFMFWSLFCLYHCNNKQKSLVVLAECAKRHPAIDENFVIFRQRKIMNEESSSENMDMLEFIICESHMRKAVKHERKAVLLQMRFWGELSSANANLQKLFLLGSSVNSEVTLADSHYAKAIQSNPKSSYVLRSYARFLLDVCNDSKRSEELMERANQLDDFRRRANIGNDGVIDIANIISNGSSDLDSAIFTINHKGIILSANPGVRTVFGYEKPQMVVGENISIFVPPPFDKIHNEFLNRYLNIGEGQIIGKLRKVFAIRSDGYLMPTMILVRQLTFGTSATFLGIFRNVPEGAYLHDYIILDNNGFIKCFTERCTDYFISTPADVQRYQMHISDWIENFNDVSNLMKDHSGYKLSMDVGEKIVDLTCTMINTVIAGVNITIIKLTDSNALAHVATLDVKDIRNEVPMNFYVDASKLKKDKKAVVKASEKGGTGAATTNKADENLDPKKSPKKDSKEKGGRKPDPGRSSSNTSNSKRHHREESHSSGKLGSDSDKKSSGSGGGNESGSRPTSPQKARVRRGSTVEGKSMHSANTSQTATTLNRLMRATFSRKIEATAQKLRLMRKSLFVVFLVSSGFAIAMNVVFKQMYDLYIGNLDDIMGIGFVYTNALVLLQRMEMFTREAPGMTDAERMARSASLQSFSAEIKNTYFNLYNRSSYLPLITQELFISPTVEIRDASHAQDVSIQNLSLNDAVSLFHSTACQIAEKVATFHQDTERRLSFLSSLFLDSIDKASTDLILQYLAACTDLVDRLHASIFWFSLLPIGIIFLLCITVIFTIFFRTNAEAKIVYRLFLDVPKDVILQMHQHCVEKLASMEENQEESAVISANGAVDKKQSGFSGIFDVQQYSSLRSRSKTAVAEGETGRFRSATAYEFVNFGKILKRILVFILVVTSYCVGFSVYGEYFLRQTSNYGAILAWTSRTSHVLQEAHYSLMMLHSNHTIMNAAVDLPTKLALAHEAIHQLDEQRQVFLYGNTDWHLDPFFYRVSPVALNGFPAQNAQLTLDLVSPHPHENTVPLCRTFNNDVMRKGLYNALDYYTDLAYDILAAVNSTAAAGDPTLQRRYLTSHHTMHVLEELTSVCFPDLFAVHNAFYMHPVISNANTINTYLHVAATVVLIGALILLYTVVFRPLMKSIEREVALTPSMLLMLPPQVLMKVESIRAFTTAQN